jgi:23S rRNA pseudouridine1911/1915/1917 synthase
MSVEPRIVHEDAILIAVDKPGGMPSASLKAGETNTVASWLIEKHPELSDLTKGEIEAGLVNRLDNDTSGIVIAAKTPTAYDDLRGQFAEGSVDKEYIALVVGSPPDSGKIEVPIAHHPKKARKMVACESDGRAREWKGRPASTSFRVMRRFEIADDEGSRFDYALLAVSISTGVRHQIRVHMAHIGCPIAGDRLYQNPKKRASDRLGLGRHFLHASKLAITHPETGERVKFESPLPPDLEIKLNKASEAR